MLRGGAPIQLEAGQSIIVESVGDQYTTFEGYKTAEETRIGLSYPELCNSLSPGDRILIADGSISITVDKILSQTELRGTVANTKELGQRKNCNLPGVKVCTATAQPYVSVMPRRHLQPCWVQFTCA